MLIKHTMKAIESIMFTTVVHVFSKVHISVSISMIM